jgi:hypothetical protein
MVCPLLQFHDEVEPGMISIVAKMIVLGENIDGAIDHHDVR